MHGNPLVHYLRLGEPNIAPSEPQFAADYELASSDAAVDRAWDLKTYPEVATAGVDPVEHYLRYGWREGRDPRQDFSTAGYLEAHKETPGNPLVHFLRGTQEARSSETEDSDWYLL